MNKTEYLAKRDVIKVLIDYGFINLDNFKQMRDSELIKLIENLPIYTAKNNDMNKKWRENPA